MNIHPLDTRFQGMTQVTAVYLIEGPEGPVLVETGPASTLPTILDALDDRGYKASDINHVLVTHIHLDHAGAAGWWAQQGAMVYVHHVGAPHLIDPSKLLGSAARIYGDLMEQLWGEVLPAPEGNVTPLYDGDTVNAGGLTFTAVDTPGHAYHHHAFKLVDDDGRAIAFTGDAAGIHLPHVGLIDLPAPPPEFHLETWLATIDRLAGLQLDRIYPTHFGPVEDVAAHLKVFRELLIDGVAFVKILWDRGAGRDQLVADYLAWHRERAEAYQLAGAALEQIQLANPQFMSVDGISRYLRKKHGG